MLRLKYRAIRWRCLWLHVPHTQSHTTVLVGRVFSALPPAPSLPVSSCGSARLPLVPCCTDRQAVHLKHTHTFIQLYILLHFISYAQNLRLLCVYKLLKKHAQSPDLQMLSCSLSTLPNKSP